MNHIPDVRKMLSAEQIKEFAKWLKENEPSDTLSDEDYFELFAYRIVDRLGV